MRRTVDAYLAEGVDLDAEGFFIERSVGVYDAVNDRSLLLIAENYGWPAAVGGGRTQPDARSATAARRRHVRDRTLAAAGLRHAARSRWDWRRAICSTTACGPIRLFSRAAQWLWDAAPTPPGHLEWLLYPLLKYGDPAPADASPAGASCPTTIALHLAQNGIYRVRRDLLSASFFRDATRLLSFTFGAAELTSLKISATYFGGDCGRFIGDRLEVARRAGRALVGGSTPVATTRL